MAAALNETSSEIGNLAVTQNNLNDFFIVISGILVFAMQAGFALMEAGLVRSKNATNILMKSTLDAFIGATAYWLIGYAFAYGDGNDFIGWTGFALQGVNANKWSFWFYQSIFANTASTIASGATAERINLPAFFVYSFLLTGVMYPLASRWAWHSTGWLKLRGFVDFGGSGVVHMLGGVCALVATLMVGPRIGRFMSKKEKQDGTGRSFAYRGHSVTLTGVGAFLLMLGILGYNMSSQNSLSQAGDGAIVAKASVNTLLAGSSGAIAATLLGRATPSGHYNWSYLTMLNGAIAGMVSSCAGCNAMPFWAAYLTGLCAGFMFFSLRALMSRLHVDDPLDAFAVHFGGGFVGMLLTPLLVDAGVILAGDYKSAVALGYQAAGILVLIAWGAGFCFVMFGLLNWFRILRVDPLMEVSGMDAMNDEPAYPADSWDEQQYWDHQVLRLVHLLSAVSANSKRNAEPVASDVVFDVEPDEKSQPSAKFALPPQMNFAHLVLTDHFQKCILSLDRLQQDSARRTKLKHSKV